MEALIRSLDRPPRPRTTLYADADPRRIALAGDAAPLTPMVQTPPRKRAAFVTGDIRPD